jgi:hypothetical protein
MRDGYGITGRGRATTTLAFSALRIARCYLRDSLVESNLRQLGDDLRLAVAETCEPLVS